MTSPSTPADAARHIASLTIVNRRGLHARASAKFVKCAERFASNITVSRDGYTVPATSIMGLMMLGAQPGTDILVVATGEDAQHALAALADLVSSGFDEDQGKQQT